MAVTATTSEVVATATEYNQALNQKKRAIRGLVARYSGLRRGSGGLAHDARPNPTFLELRWSDGVGNRVVSSEREISEW